MIKLLAIISLVVHCYASYDSYGGHNAIPAAVKSKYTSDIKTVRLPQEQIKTHIIEIPPVDMPIKILYNSKSSSVYVAQRHQPGQNQQNEATKSEEEPQRLSHEVYRPVIQELREVIVPYRRVVQQVQPVVEDIHSVVPRGEGRQNGGGGGGGMGGGFGSGKGYSGGGGGGGGYSSGGYSSGGGGGGGYGGGDGHASDIYEKKAPAVSMKKPMKMSVKKQIKNSYIKSNNNNNNHQL